MAELRGDLAGMQRAREMLAADHVGWDQVAHDVRGGSIKQEVGQAPNPVVQGVENGAGGQLLKDFMAPRAPEFYEGGDVSTTENWMLSMEKHFRSMGYDDTQRVRVASFLLRDDAERWREIVRQRYRGREPTWIEFQEAFNGHFFPDWVREQM